MALCLTSEAMKIVGVLLSYAIKVDDLCVITSTVCI